MQSTALITGGGSGIGKACAELFYSKGWQLILLGRDSKKLISLAKELGPLATPFICDLAESGAENKLSQFLKNFDWMQSRLETVINNAAVFNRKSFLESSPEEWERQIQTNLMGPTRVLRACHPFLKNQTNASVVNISSTLAFRALAMTSVYSASKAALNQLTQVLALEWAPDQIRVNAVCPGLIDTPIHDFFGHSDSTPERIQAHKAQPLGRMGLPKEIAQAAWFLASQDSAWTTGSLLTVDGGISLL